MAVSTDLGDTVRDRDTGVRRTIRAGAAVMATGGFESNIDWLKDAWGEAAERFRGAFARGADHALEVDAVVLPERPPGGDDFVISD